MFCLHTTMHICFSLNNMCIRCTRASCIACYIYGDFVFFLCRMLLLLHRNNKIIVYNHFENWNEYYNHLTARCGITVSSILTSDLKCISHQFYFECNLFWFKFGTLMLMDHDSRFLILLLLNACLRTYFHYFKLIDSLTESKHVFHNNRHYSGRANDDFHICSISNL